MLWLPTLSWAGDSLLRDEIDTCNNLCFLIKSTQQTKNKSRGRGGAGGLSSWQCRNVVEYSPFLTRLQSASVLPRDGGVQVASLYGGEGFVHLPGFIYRCRLILSLDGHRDWPSDLNLRHPNAMYAHRRTHTRTHVDKRRPGGVGCEWVGGSLELRHKDEHYSSTSHSAVCSPPLVWPWLRPPAEG